jgi:cyanophycin synthetase
MTVPSSDILIQRVTYLRGPNIWTYRPTIEVWLDLGEFEAFPSNLLPGLTERLLALLPGLGQHRCGVGEVGGFVERLNEGTWCGHILEHCVIELLNMAGLETGFGQTRSTSQTGVYRMVFRARNEVAARVALAQAHALLMATIRQQAFDVRAAVALVHDAVERHHLGPSTACIVNAAIEHGIPHIRLNDGNLVQLGYGDRQRRIWTAETDGTCAIAEAIAGDKDLTKMLLKSCGIPVPEGEVVKSPQAAWEMAQDIGVPVVVKPLDGNHGRGVSLELTQQADIEQAYTIADAEGSDVIVERFIAGNEHRILVVGGKVVAASRGESLHVMGNGRDTMRQLIDQQLNSDPRRGEAEGLPLETIILEREPVMCQLLERQGLGPDAVPADGQRVLVQRNGNMAIDCTDDIHPEVAFHAGLAARAVGLDIAGLDVVCQDISRPLLEQGGAVVEVNAGPGLLMHLQPAQGKPRPVGEAIVEHLFKAGSQPLGRIPVVGITGTRHNALIARLVTWLLQLSGQHTALACQDGLFLGDRRIAKPKPEDYWLLSHQLLVNREAQAAVFENPASLILSDGLPYDRCQVGLITDREGWQELGAHDISAPEHMIKAIRTQVDVVLEGGVAVLNAQDSAIAELAELCDGSVILYACCDEPGASEPPQALREHLAQGGRAALLQQRQMVLLEGQAQHGGADIYGWLTARGMAATPELAEAVLAALTTAWACGISPSLLSAGLDTFQPDLALN